MKAIVLIKHKENTDSSTNLFSLNKQPCVIGRNNADMSLSDPRCSKQHAVIIPEMSGMKIRDLHSKNGTYVNGKRVTESELFVGDEVRIGSTLLVVLDMSQKQILGNPQEPPRIQRNIEQEHSTITDNYQDRVVQGWPHSLLSLPGSVQQQFNGYFTTQTTSRK